MNFWPLRSPPQIAGDSATLALDDSYDSVSLPTKSNGERAVFFLIAWEGDYPIQTKQPGGALGDWLHWYGQPYLFSHAGHGASDITYYKMPTGGTGTLHITPLEAS
jgi:hypothetical protein